MVSANGDKIKWMRFQLCQTLQLSCPFVPCGTLHGARGKRSMCCAWFTYDRARATWAYVLETVRGAVRRLLKKKKKKSNCAFQCDYYYYYYYYYLHNQKQTEARKQAGARAHTHTRFFILTSTVALTHRLNGPLTPVLWSDHVSTQAVIDLSLQKNQIIAFEAENRQLVQNLALRLTLAEGGRLQRLAWIDLENNSAGSKPISCLNNFLIYQCVWAGRGRERGGGGGGACVCRACRDGSDSSFFIRTDVEWNHLDDSTVNLKTIPAFKAKIEENANHHQPVG